jgi:hypothetical protein
MGECNSKDDRCTSEVDTSMKHSIITSLQSTERYRSKQERLQTGDHTLTDDESSSHFDCRGYLNELQGYEYNAPPRPFQTAQSQIDEDLNVAVPVDESERNLQAAIAMDPDKKESRSTAQSVRSNILLVIIGTLFFVVFLTTIAVRVTLRTKGEKPIYDKPISPRLQLGIKDMIVRNIPSIADKLQNPTNPYSKALHWLKFDDPHQLEPKKSRTILQRFLMAYFYFATAVDQDWENCPPKTTSTSGNGVSSSYCREFTYSKYTGTVQKKVSPVGWLSNKSECAWPGVTCDLQGQVVIIELSKLLLRIAIGFCL